MNIVCHGSDSGEAEPAGTEQGPDILSETLPAGHRSGFVSVVGRPNVGKSSLMNAYLGQKVAIVTPKPQTTRNRLLGILTTDRAQVVFIDTPGIHRPSHQLGRHLVEVAAGAIPDADVVLFVVDVSSPPRKGDYLTAELLKERFSGQVILAMNKVDLLKPAAVQAHVDAYLSLGTFTEWMLVSAIRGDNLSKLMDLMLAHLPEGPRFFPADQITDQQERFLAAELIREQVLLQTHQEVPHGVAVAVEEFHERRPGLVYISAFIYVERETHKGIIIGNKGERLKQIGTLARQAIEEMLEAQVFLELWTKVRKNWRQDERQLRDLGYTAY